jgi:hypothetical protein
MRGRVIPKRGLSTVIGAVFIIIIITSGLGFGLWMVQQQDRVTEAILEKTNSNLQKLSEHVSISDVKVVNDKLNLTVTNSGGSAATLRSLYVVNETASPKEQYRYEINKLVDGRSAVTNIGYTNPAFVIQNDKEYSIKVVSRSGHSVSARLTTISEVALPMSLVVIPPTAPPGTNVTILFAVTNNLTDSHLPVSLSPTLSKVLSCGAGPSCQFTDYVSPSPQIITKGATTLFKWVSKVDAPDGTTLTFNASLANAKNGNYVIELGRVANVNSGGVVVDGVIGEDLLYKPEIFPVLPGPFGESSQQALWGVVIANPVNSTLKVSKVVFTLQSPDFQGNQYVLVASGCSNTPVYPTSAAEWSCPAVGVIMWKDNGSPEPLIQPYSARAFMVRVDPGDLPVDEPAFLVSATVFTSYGQFAKAGYSGTMRNNGGSLGSVYLTNTAVEANAVQTANMLGNVSGFRSGQQKLVYVALADLDTVSTTSIKAGTTLIVNVPKGFTNVALNSWAGFDNTPTVTTFPDGTTRIIATLSNNLGTVAGSPQAKVLSFNVTPPSVSQNTVFIMHTLSDGETTDATPFSVNPFGGFALLVSP